MENLKPIFRIFFQFLALNSSTVAMPQSQWRALTDGADECASVQFIRTLRATVLTTKKHETCNMNLPLLQGIIM